MNKQPANRTAALGASAAAVVAVLVSLLGAVDTDRKAAVLIAAIVTIGLLAAVFLVGSQRWEALIFRQATGTPDQTVEVTSGDAKPDVGPGVPGETIAAAGGSDDYFTEPTPEDDEPLAEDPS